MSSLEDMVQASAGMTRPELSLDRSDPERRLGLPSGRFTAPGPVLAPLVAGAMTVGFYALLRLAPDNFVSLSFTERGPTPYAIAAFGFWGLCVLLVKARKLAVQKRALGLRLLPSDDPAFTLTPESAERVLETLFKTVDDPQRFFLTRRIHHALVNLKNMRQIGDVDAVLKTQSEQDEAQVDSSYTLLKGILWTLPVLGFIGTVLGLSVALGSFGSVLSSASDIGQLRGALQTVTGGLSTAFETTLQGLVAVVALQLGLIFVRGHEDRFLEDCGDYCQRFIVSRLRLTETPR